MADWQIVLVKITAMFLVILVGWAVRRRGYLPAETTRILSRFVVDIAFPALVFTQMLRTVTLGALREGWFAPLLMGLLIVIAYGAGLLVAPFFCRAEQKNTFVFLATIPNWIFLPLPIVEAMYGDAGVRTLLLGNVGAQLMLWSFGVWILHGGVTPREAARHIVTNPGLIATALGILVALLIPSSHNWEIGSLSQSPPQLAAGAVVQALAMVGTMTIPVSLLAIGAQLGDLELHVHRPSRALWGVLLARLIVGPLLTMAVGWIVLRAGVTVPEVPRRIGYLIATMPVAISCSMFTERFGGDVSLGAQGIFYSTLFSLLTVPVFFFVIQRLGL
ncbi:MAG TPA: AEC family transporter [Verrucomicrobiae bacterium]|nr:AEC family transporter [Verrucomicrobiae bacterium]